MKCDVCGRKTSINRCRGCRLEVIEIGTNPVRTEELLSTIGHHIDWVLDNLAKTEASGMSPALNSHYATARHRQIMVDLRNEVNFYCGKIRDIQNDFYRAKDEIRKLEDGQ